MSRERAMTSGLVTHALWKPAGGLCVHNHQSTAQSLENHTRQVTTTSNHPNHPSDQDSTQSQTRSSALGPILLCISHWASASMCFRQIFTTCRRCRNVLGNKEQYNAKCGKPGCTKKKPINPDRQVFHWTFCPGCQQDPCSQCRTNNEPICDFQESRYGCITSQRHGRRCILSGQQECNSCKASKTTGCNVMTNGDVGCDNCSRIGANCYVGNDFYNQNMKARDAKKAPPPKQQGVPKDQKCRRCSTLSRRCNLKRNPDVGCETCSVDGFECYPGDAEEPLPQDTSVKGAKETLSTPRLPKGWGQDPSEKCEPCKTAAGRACDLLTKNNGLGCTPCALKPVHCLKGGIKYPRDPTVISDRVRRAHDARAATTQAPAPPPPMALAPVWSGAPVSPRPQAPVSPHNDVPSIHRAIDSVDQHPSWSIVGRIRARQNQEAQTMAFRPGPNLAVRPNEDPQTTGNRMAIGDALNTPPPPPPPPPGPRSQSQQTRQASRPSSPTTQVPSRRADSPARSRPQGQPSADTRHRPQSPIPGNRPEDPSARYDTQRARPSSPARNPLLRRRETDSSESSGNNDTGRTAGSSPRGGRSSGQGSGGQKSSGRSKGQEAKRPKK